MATIQSKITNGHKYWYIVESRRINGKARPVVLKYLGKAESLYEKLTVQYSLEALDADTKPLVECFALKDIHNNPPEINGLSTY